MAVRVLIADDSADARLALRAEIRRIDSNASILEARDGKAAVRIMEDKHPTIAILDVRMPHMGGVEAAAIGRKLGVTCHLVTSHPPLSRASEDAVDRGDLASVLPKWLRRGLVDSTLRSISAAYNWFGLPVMVGIVVLMSII